ncbi:hypothetical protein HY837_00530, partial [archaeon]|nr:hypothetical protein [archaeon]
MNKMNLNNLEQKLSVEERKTLETATQMFPEFREALNGHLELVKQGKVVSPYETKYEQTFKRAFSEVPALSVTYAKLVGFVLPEKDPDTQQ